MKNKIIPVVLAISVLLSLSCQSDKSFYPKDNVSIIGFFKDKEDENIYYLVFSIPQESFFYCSGVKEKENPLADEVSFYFIRSKIKESITKNEVDYKSDFVKNDSYLLEQFSLDPSFYYIKVKKLIKELNIYDAESNRKVVIENLNR